MRRLGDLVHKVRSKNAGPFWVTCDIFCGSIDAFNVISQNLTTERVAGVFRQPQDAIKRFDISELKVIKFSLPRPVVQGSRFDRDMHGAQYGVLLADTELDIS